MRAPAGAARCSARSTPLWSLRCANSGDEDLNPLAPPRTEHRFDQEGSQSRGRRSKIAECGVQQERRAAFPSEISARLSPTIDHSLLVVTCVAPAPYTRKASPMTLSARAGVSPSRINQLGSPEAPRPGERRPPYSRGAAGRRRPGRGRHARHHRNATKGFRASGRHARGRRAAAPGRQRLAETCRSARKGTAHQARRLVVYVMLRSDERRVLGSWGRRHRPLIRSPTQRSDSPEVGARRLPRAPRSAPAGGCATTRRQVRVTYSEVQ